MHPRNGLTSILNCLNMRKISEKTSNTHLKESFTKLGIRE